MKENDLVNHPNHYGGKDNPYEAIKVIENWKLNFNLGNAIKYLARADHCCLGFINSAKALKEHETSTKHSY